MTIDFHVHIWKDQKQYLKAFVTAMDDNDVGKAVVQVLPGWAREVRPGIWFKGADNQEVVEQIDDYPDRFILFATLNPQVDDSIAKLDELTKRYDLKGLKLHPAIQGFSPTNPRVVRFVRRAAELKLPLMFHTGDVGWVGRLAYNDVHLMDDLAIMVPEATIIIAHGASTPITPLIVGRHENMYMDTAYAVNWPSLPPFNWKFQCINEDIIEHLGAHKVLYGTDLSPNAGAHSTQVKGTDIKDPTDISRLMKQTIGIISGLKISHEDKHLILEGNARRLLDL
jgi:hypothetical protein